MMEVSLGCLPNCISLKSTIMVQLPDPMLKSIRTEVASTAKITVVKDFQGFFIYLKLKVVVKFVLREVFLENEACTIKVLGVN